MAIQVNGCTVIDDGRNIVNANDIRVGVVTITGSTGDITTPGTISAAAFDIPVSPIAFLPPNGATGVDLENQNRTIVVSFPSNVAIGTTGTITVRRDSSTGTILQSTDITSPLISIEGTIFKLNLNVNVNFYTGLEIFLVIPETALENFQGLNVSGGPSYSFTSINLPPLFGTSFEGGFLICRSGGVRWIVAPNTAEVSRTWYGINDANARAQQVSGCTGWFVPTITQLQNPGYTCRTFWDSFSSTNYWSSTESNITSACNVNFATGIVCGYGGKTTTRCVRAFRCVTY
jgi:hypothetical protein